MFQTKLFWHNYFNMLAHITLSKLEDLKIMLGYKGPISGIFSFLLATSTTTTKNNLTSYNWDFIATLFQNYNFISHNCDYMSQLCQSHTKDT